MRNFFLLTIITNCLIPSLICKLLFVFELFRHGARSPLFNVTKLPNEDSYIDCYHTKWPNAGKLTNLGYRMQYILGLHNRYRYNEFLTNLTIPNDIHVLSTRTVRAFVSAQAHLIGMFPNDEVNRNVIEDDKLDKAIPPIEMNEQLQNDIDKMGNMIMPYSIQRIPINYFDDIEIDTILTEPDVCPNMKEYKAKRRVSAKVKEFQTKVNNTYGLQLAKFFKWNSTDYLFNYKTIFTMLENFATCYESKQDLSEFKSYGIDFDIYNEFAKEVRLLYLAYVEYSIETTPFSMSITIPKLIQWMEDAMKGKVNTPKLVIYSGHDSTLSPFQLYMERIFNVSYVYPTFGSFLYFELHQNDSNPKSYYVKYIFNDKEKLQVNFNEFKDKVLDGLWDNDQIQSFCGIEIQSIIRNWKLYLVIGGVGIVFLIGMMFVSIAGNSQKNKKKQEEGEEMILKTGEND